VRRPWLGRRGGPSGCTPRGPVSIRVDGRAGITARRGASRLGAGVAHVFGYGKSPAHRSSGDGDRTARVHDRGDRPAGWSWPPASPSACSRPRSASARSAPAGRADGCGRNRRRRPRAPAGV